MNPICTIAIPVYNRYDIISNALDSSLSQGIENIEILVIDNCSTDGTWEVLQSYTDRRLRIIRNQSNVGLFGNFNRCLSLAKGKYLRILCSDDRLIKNCLVSEVKYMEKYTNASVLTTRSLHVDQFNKPLRIGAGHLNPGIYEGKKMICNALWIQAYYGDNPLNCPSGILIRREVAVKCGYFNENFRFTADMDYWLRLLEYGDLIVLSDIGCEVIEHPGREAHRLFLEGHLMSNHFEMVKRREIFIRSFNKHLYQKIMYQMAGRCLWYVLKTLCMGEWRSAYTHLEMIKKYRLSYVIAMIALGRHVIIRLYQKISNRRHILYNSFIPITNM